MTIPRAGDHNWEEDVLGSPRPVLVEFMSTTCPVCARMEPVVQRVAAEAEGRADVYQVDVESEEDLVWAYQVMSTPTFVLLRGGEVEATLHGDVPYGELSALLGETVPDDG